MWSLHWWSLGDCILQNKMARIQRAYFRTYKKKASVLKQLTKSISVLSIKMYRKFSTILFLEVLQGMCIFLLIPVFRSSHQSEKRVLDLVTKLPNDSNCIFPYFQFHFK